MECKNICKINYLSIKVISTIFILDLKKINCDDLSIF